VLSLSRVAATYRLPEAFNLAAWQPAEAFNLAGLAAAAPPRQLFV